MTRLERYVMVATVAISAGGLGLAGLQYVKPASEQAISPVMSNPPVPIQVSVVSAPTPAPPSKLSQLMTARTVGRNIDYVESIIGIPTEIGSPKTTETFRYYTVEGCNIWIRTDADKAVSLLSIIVTPACSFEWRDMMPNFPNLPRPENTTFRALFGSPPEGVSQVEGCVSSCGNMADPEVTLLRTGSHADNWISVKLGLTIAQRRAVDAAATMTKALRSQVGEFIAEDLASLCDKRIANLAVQYLGDFKINRVEFSNEQFYQSKPGTCDLTTL